MATKVIFRASKQDFVRNIYYKSSDRHRLSDEELNEVLKYKDISENFEYNDWYGSSTPVKATLKEVKQGTYGELLFVVTINKSIPEHYIPSPSDILKGKDLLFPVSYSLIKL